MKSQRLPGKALLKLGEFSLIERVIRRAKLLDFPIILATSSTVEDDILEDVAIQLNITCFRGSEKNVLERAVLASKKYNLNAFARLCGDRPLFSLKEISFAIKTWQAYDVSYKPDLITNNWIKKSVKGLTTELINVKSLENQLNDNPDKEQKEHLTTGFYRKSNLYKILNIESNYQLGFSNNCFAVDTLDDLIHINNFVKKHPAINYELDFHDIPRLQD